MKWIRYELKGKVGYGLVEGEKVAEYEGVPYGEHKKTGNHVRMADVKLLYPLVPPTFYAAGLNYITHRKKMAERTGKPLELPSQQDIGYRANNALISPGESIVVPRDSAGKLQYEGELVVIIGKKVKHVSEADALSCVFGYTIGNDVSERIWQRGDRTFWRGKNADTFKPMGPYIETDIGDLNDLMTTVRLNGKEVSRFRTNDMLFGVEETIATITRYNTLYPGDMIWMGTDEPTLDMVAGDVVEVEISKLGVLKSPVVAET